MKKGPSTPSNLEFKLANLSQSQLSITNGLTLPCGKLHK